jgi:hypothetical protein
VMRSVHNCIACVNQCIFAVSSSRCITVTTYAATTDRTMRGSCITSDPIGADAWRRPPRLSLILQVIDQRIAAVANFT